MTRTDERLPQPEQLRNGTVPALFAQVVGAMPEAVAVRDAQGRSWSYAELADAAAGFASLMRDFAPREDGSVPRVGLHLPHGVPMIAAQLGALEAGCCYVPLDPSYPAARLQLMARIAGLDAVVEAAAGPSVACSTGRAGSTGAIRRLQTSEDGLLADLASARSGMRASSNGSEAGCNPDRPAYILFTSGSTGRPKGVLHTHRTMLHGIANHVANMAITPDDRLTVLTSFSFDMAVTDLYAGLLAGATAMPLDVRTLGVPGLAQGLADGGATVFHATPTVFRLLAAQGRSVPTVRLAILGGEPVHRNDIRAARTMFADGCVLVNGYGFTEASFVVQSWFHPGDPIGTEAVLPIGRALPGYEVRVENPDADGVGDLVVVSDVLARGYVEDPEQTRARFSTDLRTYRPGDRVRMLPDGRLTFAGRTDSQVKIGGVRVELAEIQQALERQLDVARATVLVDERDGATVVAHVQPAPGTELLARTLRARLREELPDAMVPARIHVTDALPLTPTGKVDVRALSEADSATVPETGDERVVLDAWVTAVGADPGGLDVPFFDAGGSSLALARLHQSLSRSVAEPPPLAALLGAGTVRRMALLLMRSEHRDVTELQARLAKRAARRRPKSEAAV